MNQHIDNEHQDFEQDVQSQLRRLFAAAAQPLDGVTFEQQLALRLQSAQRRRRIQLALLLLTLLGVSALLTIPFVRAWTWLDQYTGSMTLGFGEFLVSRTGYACSLLIAGWVLMKAGMFKRS